MEKGRTVREAVRSFRLSFFRSICGYRTGAGCRLLHFFSTESRNWKKGMGCGPVKNFYRIFFYFQRENVRNCVGCPRFLAEKAVEKNGKDCQCPFQNKDTCSPF